MTTNSITNSEGIAIQKSAKTAGLAYLLIIVSSILALIFGPFKLISEGNIAETISNIDSNQLLYKIGFTYDLLMFMGVIILSVALFKVLESVNKTSALLALICRIAEALIGSLTVICSMMILWMIGQDGATESHQKTIEFLFEMKDALLHIVFAFLGLGSLIFCSLFYRARYIPRLLAAFGILAFALVFGESIAVLLFSVKSTVVTGAPAILFEIAIGLWLMIKGVNTKYWTSVKN